MTFSFARPAAASRFLAGESVNAGGVCDPFFYSDCGYGVVSCAIETAGDAPASKLLPLAKLCDEVLFDLKIMDAAQARDVVKMNLQRVLENLRLLVSEGVNVIPRLPLIPGFTLSRENMQQALGRADPAEYQADPSVTVSSVRRAKYRLLGKTWSMKEVAAPSSADVATMREMAERAGFQVTVGG